MKLLVRASVLSLVFAGAFASAFTPKTHASSTVDLKTTVVSTMLPIPTCPPDGKNTCGLP